MSIALAPKKCGQLEARPARGNPRWWLFGMVLSASVACTTAVGADLQRLQDLLAPLPAGSWVQANTNLFSSAFPQGSVAVDFAPYTNPALIVPAWSSFAWDSNRGNLLLFGGGHANYAGNEVYVWNGASGAWTLGSLPSRINAQGYIPDNSAPMSAHTYDNNQFLPVNDRFLDIGGAAFPGGGAGVALVNGQVAVTGPWLWNPALANSALVGGSSGSGYDAGSVGGNMWTNRQNQGSATAPNTFINGTSAYRTEGGQDVVYITADPYQSGWPQLYRYAVGNLQLGQQDSWALVGTNSYQGAGFKGVGAIDQQHNLFVRTIAYPGRADDLLVWDLTNAGNAAPAASLSVSLAFADGTPFAMNSEYGLDYDQSTGLFYAWDGGAEQGAVYAFAAQTDANGKPLSQWTVVRQAATSAAKPQGNFVTGVLGKWQYVQQLDAFVALDEYRNGDAQVWLYKAGPLAAVPEAGRAQLLLAGLALVLLAVRRGRRGRQAG